MGDRRAKVVHADIQRGLGEFPRIVEDDGYHEDERDLAAAMMHQLRQWAQAISLASRGCPRVRSSRREECVSSTLPARARYIFGSTTLPPFLAHSSALL